MITDPSGFHSVLLLLYLASWIQGTTNLLTRSQFVFLLGWISTQPTFFSVFCHQVMVLNFTLMSQWALKSKKYVFVVAALWCEQSTVVTITLSQLTYKAHCFVVLCVVITRRVVQQFFFLFLNFFFLAWVKMDKLSWKLQTTMGVLKLSLQASCHRIASLCRTSKLLFPWITKDLTFTTSLSL